MSKDWTMNIGTFSKDWVMNVGAYSTSSGGGEGGTKFPTFTIPADPSDYTAYSCDMTYAEVKAVWETEKDTITHIPCKETDGIDTYWSTGGLGTVEDLPVTEGFSTGSGYLFGSDGNFYGYMPK